MCLSISGAMTNSSGVWNEAATVWPGSTSRLMTMPASGEMMCVYSRLAFELSTAASDWATVASAWATLALDKSTWAAAVSRANL